GESAGGVWGGGGSGGAAGSAGAPPRNLGAFVVNETYPKGVAPRPAEPCSCWLKVREGGPRRCLTVTGNCERSCGPGASPMPQGDSARWRRSDSSLRECAHTTAPSAAAPGDRATE